MPSILRSAITYKHSVNNTNSTIKITISKKKRHQISPVHVRKNFSRTITALTQLLLNHKNHHPTTLMGYWIYSRKLTRLHILVNTLQ